MGFQPKAPRKSRAENILAIFTPSSLSKTDDGLFEFIIFSLNISKSDLASYFLSYFDFSYTRLQHLPLDFALFHTDPESIPAYQQQTNQLLSGGN